MSEFLTLFKHELKMQFAFLSYNKKKKHDILGSLLSILLTLGVIVLIVTLATKIANGYIGVKVNKVLSPNQRATELLNIFYAISMVMMVLICILKMRSTLTIQKHKEIYLKLPIKEQNLFLSKLATIMIWNFILGAIIILPVNIIFYIALQPSFVFWLKTALVLLLMPIVVFGISAVLILPVIKIVEFLKNKYWLVFVIFTGALVVVFLGYSKLLQVIQLWLETGSIKFLFNSNFVNGLQNCLKWLYPINCFANLMMGNKIALSLIVILLFVAISVAISWFVSNRLFHLTLYKNSNEHKTKKSKPKYTQTNSILSLMKKEFICVYRNPSHLFSYFTIAISMPLMVYCCYTLFESLILNAFGLKITFSLALLVLLIFSILTNTFCATNVSRDGLAFLKMKSLPIKPAKLLLTKILFCGIVSTLSILLSGIILALATSITFVDILLCILIVVPFSFAQIMIATKLDLKNAKFSSTQAETEAINGKTVTKVILIGLLVALVMGIISVVIYLLSQGSGIKIISNLKLKEIYSYILPIVICVIYFVCAIVYYNHKIDKTFDNLIG